MKNRTDEIWTTLGAFIEERSVADVLLTISRFDENAGALVPAMRRALLECDKQARQWRQAGEKGATSFIALSFLDTSVITETFDLRIDFYDSSFIEDIAESSAYFPTPIFAPYITKAWTPSAMKRRKDSFASWTTNGTISPGDIKERCYTSWSCPFAPCACSTPI
jgi:hypothetical protein